MSAGAAAGRAAAPGARGPEAPRQRLVVTPEGVPLTLVISRVGDRLAACLIDFAVVGGVILVLYLAGGLALRDRFLHSWAGAFTIYLSFLVANFYFAWLEYRWRGVTLGKRALRIRVADVTGGALTGEAVVARNLTRNFELVLPLQGLAFMSLALPDVSGWLWLLGSVWLVAFGLMPLFNRDRRRVGDLVAGTMVVDMPRVVLLEDLGARGRSRGDAESEFEFSAEQLDLYGAYELQVLEDLLRLGYDADPRALEEVCTRIKRKIGWDRKRWDVNTRRFLMAFYKAQRHRLEQKLLLGHHRERKRS